MLFIRLFKKRRRVSCEVFCLKAIIYDHFIHLLLQIIPRVMNAAIYDS